MKTQIQVKVQVAFWLQMYLYGVMLFAYMFNAQPDEKKVNFYIKKGTRIRYIKNGVRVKCKTVYIK